MYKRQIEDAQIAIRVRHLVRRQVEHPAAEIDAIAHCDQASAGKVIQRQMDLGSTNITRKNHLRRSGRRP